MGGDADRMVAKEKIAYIFPGQGAQYVGMGRDLYDTFKEAREVFDKANEILGFDIKGLCFDGPQEKLSTTTYSQPAILTTSIAALRSMESRISGISAVAVLGLSLGEYSALVAGGAMEFNDAVNLVSLRGRYMEEASNENPGKMASIIGMDVDGVEKICSEASCEIANLNCPGQVVISGRKDAIDKAAALAKEKGAKRAIVLDVSGPFHSSLMKGAREKLAGALEAVEIKKPESRFVCNVNASYEEGGEAIKANLLNQLTGRTYWEDSIRLLVKEGVKTFYEIGPGKVLKGLLRRIDPGLAVNSLGTVEDIEKLSKEGAEHAV